MCVCGYRERQKERVRRKNRGNLNRDSPIVRKEATERIKGVVEVSMTLFKNNSARLVSKPLSVAGERRRKFEIGMVEKHTDYLPVLYCSKRKWGRKKATENENEREKTC